MSLLAVADSAGAGGHPSAAAVASGTTTLPSTKSQLFVSAGRGGRESVVGEGSKETATPVTPRPPYLLVYRRVTGVTLTTDSVMKHCTLLVLTVSDKETTSQRGVQSVTSQRLPASLHRSVHGKWNGSCAFTTRSAYYLERSQTCLAGEFLELMLLAPQVENNPVALDLKKDRNLFFLPNSDDLARTAETSVKSLHFAHVSIW